MQPQILTDLQHGISPFHISPVNSSITILSLACAVLENLTSSVPAENLCLRGIPFFNELLFICLAICANKSFVAQNDLTGYNDPETNDRHAGKYG